MKHLTVLIPVVLLAGLFLSACVPREKYDNLKAQNDELKQTIETQKRMGDDADKLHLARTSGLEERNLDLKKRLTEARTELRGRQRALEELQKKYADVQKKHKAASGELSKAVTNRLALIKEKNKLNATIITLRGDIATLKDTVKDLKKRLDENKPIEPRTGPADLPPKSTP